MTLYLQDLERRREVLEYASGDDLEFGHAQNVTEKVKRKRAVMEKKTEAVGKIKNVPGPGRQCRAADWHAGGAGGRSSDTPRRSRTPASVRP